jgi:hypothetical protein
MSDSEMTDTFGFIFGFLFVFLRVFVFKIFCRTVVPDPGSAA